MSIEESAPSLLDERLDDLEVTRNIRKRLLMKNLPGGEIPADTESQEMILKIAGEIDKAVTTVAKIENDRQKVAIDKNNARSQQQFLDNMQRILQGDIGITDVVTGEIIELPTELSQLKDPVPGEMDVGSGPLELKDFT